MTGKEVKFWAKGLADAFLEIEINGLWRCPECKHLMGTPPNDYHICPHCNVEFGYDAKSQEGEKLWPLNPSEHVKQEQD
jgi:rubrerythrin